MMVIQPVVSPLAEFCVLKKSSGGKMLKYEDIVAKGSVLLIPLGLECPYTLQCTFGQQSVIDPKDLKQAYTINWEKKQRHNSTTSRCITATGQMEINKSALDEELFQVHLKFKSKNMNWSNFHSTWGSITGSPYNMDALGWDGAAYGCSFLEQFSVIYVPMRMKYHWTTESMCNPHQPAAFCQGKESELE